MNTIPRIININASDTETTVDSAFLGFSGEHLATKLIITIPSNWRSAKYIYLIKFKTPDGQEEPTTPIKLSQNGNIEYVVPQQITLKEGSVSLQIQTFAGKAIVKSSISVNLTVKPSLTGFAYVDDARIGLLDSAILKFNEAQDKLPYIDDETGTWFVYDLSLGEYVDTGKKAIGSGGSGTPDYSTMLNRSTRLIQLETRNPAWGTEDPDTHPRLFLLGNGGIRSENLDPKAWVFEDSPYFTYNPLNGYWEIVAPIGYNSIEIFCNKKDETGERNNWHFFGRKGDFLNGKRSVYLPPIEICKNIRFLQNVDESGNNGGAVLFNADTNKQLIFWQGGYDEPRREMVAHYGCQDIDVYIEQKMSPLGWQSNGYGARLQYYAVEIPEFYDKSKNQRNDRLYFTSDIPGWQTELYQINRALDTTLNQYNSEGNGFCVTLPVLYTPAPQPETTNIYAFDGMTDSAFLKHLVGYDDADMAEYLLGLEYVLAQNNIYLQN